MKKIIVTTLLSFVALTGCKKQSINAQVENEPKEVIQFQKADQHIGQLIEQLDDSRTTLELRKQIICHDWPNVYFNEYAPALLKLSMDYSPDELKSDFVNAADYYKDINKIQCE